jgi:hypothetical protein
MHNVICRCQPCQDLASLHLAVIKPELVFPRWKCPSSGTVDLRDCLGGPISHEAGLLPERETVT